MTTRPSVALVGAGAMGGALLRGWLGAGSVNAVRTAVFEPAPREEIKALCRAHGLALNPDIKGLRADALVIAVKPQAAADALPAFAPIAANALVISVMAGKSIDSVAAALGGAPRAARAMPNLAAAVGKGVVALYAPDTVNTDGRAMTERLMAAAGDVVWVKSEREIDFATAVSGSGPAYFFLLAEALAEAGEALGLPKEAASRLARATLAGAGALMERETRSPADLRRAVTSPGGTTEAALKILDGDQQKLRKLMKEAVAAAAKRARKLTD